MLFDVRELFHSQFAALQQNMIGDSNFADVMQQGRHDHTVQWCVLQAEPHSSCARNCSDTCAMTACVRIAQIDERYQSTCHRQNPFPVPVFHLHKPVAECLAVFDLSDHCGDH